MGIKNSVTKTIVNSKDIQNLLNLIQTNQLETAEKNAKELIKKFDKNFILFDCLAKTQIKQKKVKEAIDSYKKALKINPKFYSGYNNVGNLLKNTGKFLEAKTYYLKAIKIEPNFINAHYNLGIVLIDIGEIKKATNSFQTALRINPNHAESYINLGITFKILRKFNEAINCFNKAIALKPGFIQSYNNLGNIFFEIGNFNKSVEYYKQAIKLEPKYAKAHQNLMEAYEKMNKEKELDETLLNAKSLFGNTSIIKLYSGILSYKKNKFSDAKKLLEEISFDRPELKNEILRISNLAKCYDRIGNYNKAFECFDKTNYLVTQQQRKIVLNKKRFLKEIDSRTKYFKKKNINKWNVIKNLNTKDSPIFLIGFPRSGTTLLDTILRSHSQIEVIEEKFIVKKLIDALDTLSVKKFDRLKKIKEDEIKRIRKIYLHSLNQEIINKSNSKIYIDKLPLNIIHVGEIIRIFPNAKFILSLRHPCDCVLSCFMQNFQLNDAMANFLNLKDTANLYSKVMKLWDQYISIFNVNHHVIRYEDLIKNFEKTIKNLLIFLEKDWDPVMLEYIITAKNRSRIATPSYDQVIQPIYNHALNRYKNYKKETAKIYSILKPWINKFNY